MKKKLILWLIALLTPLYTKREKERINRFKSYFRIYFEGTYEENDTINFIPVSRFGITDLEFKFSEILPKNALGLRTKKVLMLDVTIVLERPGLLIGKGGKTIDNFNNWLSKYYMKVHIKESKLWNRLK